jgi:expansin (peptidoglycan-binding protein)
VNRWWRGTAAAAAIVVVGLVTVLVVRGLSGEHGTAVPVVASTSPSAGTTTVPVIPTTTTSPSASTSATATTSPGSTATSDDVSLAGRLRPGVTRSGIATYYDADGSGACSYDASSDTMTAAMNWKDYEGSNACGAYVAVRSSGGRNVTVRITNECPSPCQVGQLDLSPQAFAELAPLKTGQISVTWTLLSPGTIGDMSVRYKTGSSQWWCGIQVIDHRNPVARLEVKVSGTWTRLPRATYNYFLSEDGSGCGGAVRVTDIYGERIVLGTFPISPDVTRSTGKQFTRH